MIWYQSGELFKNSPKQARMGMSDFVANSFNRCGVLNASPLGVPSPGYHPGYSILSIKYRWFSLFIIMIRNAVINILMC